MFTSLAGVPRGQSKFGALRRFVMSLPLAEAQGFAATLEKIVAFMSQGSEPASVSRARLGDTGNTEDDDEENV